MRRSSSLASCITGLLGVTALLVSPPAPSVAAPEAAGTASPVAEQGTAPVTVPALQEWEPGGRDYLLPRGAIRVEVDRRHADELTEDARTFAEDLRALTGKKVVVVPAPPTAARRAGELHLTLTPQWTDHGPEASRLTVDGAVTISGPTSDGVFAGTRSVLQLLAQSDRIPAGTATDWPAYAERSLMVDNGRKYFTPAWAREHIRELSYLKYNQFHWHFSDNAGFRIESRTHPEVVSPEHWTQEQVRELVAYADKYHVEVLPEIDMPGHMQFALRTHPELQIVDANGNRNANNIDPTKPAARAFVRDILDELIPLFSGRYVHTGGDEFTGDWTKFPVLTDWARAKYGPDANAQDAVLDFTNWVDDVVRSHGKTMRIWNDGGQGGSQVEANRDIVLEYWSSQHGGVLAQEFLDEGYRLVNANRDVLYDVPAATPTWNNLDPRKVYDGWDMTQWHDWIGPNTTAAHHPGILGGQIHLWNDSPNAATEEQEAGRLAMPLRAMSEHLWGSERRAATWDELAARAFTVGREPQWSTGLSPAGNLAQGGLAWSSSRERPDCHESALVDGDPTTRWCGPKAAPQSVVLDLGRTTDLATVVLRWQTAFAKGYTLEVSDDLQSWRPLATTSSGDGGLDIVPVQGHGRYLRLSMTERGTVYGYSLFEIEAYGPRAVVPAHFSASVDPRVVLTSAGTAGEATLTVTSTSDEPTTVTWSAHTPDGVQLAPATGTLRVPAGGQAEAPLRATATAPGTARVPVTVTATSGGQQVPLATPELLVSVPYDELAAAFSNTGVTDDGDIDPPGLGTGFDGAGSSYSAQALAAEGLTPGAELTVEGVPLAWPAALPGTPDNVVANGQSVRLDTTGSILGVLTAATYGPVSGDWVVHYADGTSTAVRLATPDWTSAPPAGSTAVADMTYRNNTETGRTARRSQVFFQGIPVDPTKEVAALTLPAVSPTAVRGSAALHVFAVGVG